MHTWTNPAQFRPRSIVVVLALLASVVGTATPALAAPTATTVAEGFVGPLGLAVGRDGTIYVAEAFAGQLTSIDARGRRTILAGTGNEIAGVDAAGRGNAVYVESTYEAPGEPGGEPGQLVDAVLATARPNGRTTTVASLADHERALNPDAGVSYGFEDVSDDCLATLPPFIPPSYTGVVDSHPYAVATYRGRWYVADAAGNDIVRVDRRGRTATVAVLPPVTQTVTAEIAAEFGLDDCVVGATYRGEFVPTDVEVGPDGALYITSLPGIPESPGAASVWRLDLASGDVRQVATGLVSATDLAVAADGTIYVAELFANRISTIVDGVVTPWIDVPLPAAVEIGPDGNVYATTGALGVGSVVRITP